MSQRPFRVIAVVAHTIEVDVGASNSRHAAHEAINQVRKAKLVIDGVECAVTAMEVLKTRASPHDT